MVQGKKHVERIPEDWVDSVRPRVAWPGSSVTGVYKIENDMPMLEFA